MKKSSDFYIGKKYYMLTVVSSAPDYIRQSGKIERQFLFKCDCGNTKIIRLKNAQRGRPQSCGCLMDSERRPDPIGKKFGHLTVLSGDFDNPSILSNKRTLTCQCDCGKIKKLTRNYLINSNNQNASCGCKNPHYKHGLSGTPTHKIWRGLFKRCYCKTNKDYPNYGGRGITIADKYKNFSAFLFDVGERPSTKHSLDRIDNNRGYIEGNMRWATPTQQARNSRKNRIITHNGTSKCVSEWAEHLNIKRNAIYNRLYSKSFNENNVFSIPFDKRYNLNTI